jgi:hypothetical protein
VSFGNQKNFQSFMQSLKEQYPDGFVPDEEWYRAFIAKAIVFRTTQALVKARKFSAYQANITAYTVALLSWKSGGRIDFDRVWSQQSVSKELRTMLEVWVVDVDKQLRRSAGSRTVSEWAKKAECQTASDRDPGSASKRDPTFLRFEGLALAAPELVGVAEAGRARVVE